MATVVSLDQLGVRISADLKEKAQSIRRAIRSTVHLRAPLFLQEEIARARPRPPVDRGNYRHGWKVEDVSDGTIVYNPLVYAGVLELGRRKGKAPPPGILAEWVLRKGITRDPRIAAQIGFAIGRKMAQDGWPFPPNSPMRILEKATKRLMIEVKLAVKYELTMK